MTTTSQRSDCDACRGRGAPAAPIASHWPFEQWEHVLPEHTTAVSILDRLLQHAAVVAVRFRVIMKIEQKPEETKSTSPVNN
nr:ATP-binding protein [Frankia sp. Cppng1_Ct_nod]